MSCMFVERSTRCGFQENGDPFSGAPIVRIVVFWTYIKVNPFMRASKWCFAVVQEVE